MTKLIYCPVQVMIKNEDIEITDKDDSVITVINVDVPEEISTESEILIAEFDDDNFCRISSASYIDEKNLLWILNQLKKIEIPKIVYSISQYKSQKQLSLIAPQIYCEIIKSKLLEFDTPFSYSKIDKIIDNEKQTIDFIYR